MKVMRTEKVATLYTNMCVQTFVKGAVCQTLQHAFNTEF